MWLQTLQLKNIKSFADSGPIQFSKGINLLVGPNNSGKSAVLRAAYLLQGPESNPNHHGDFIRTSMRLDSQDAEVRLTLADTEVSRLRCIPDKFDTRGWQAEFTFSQSASRYNVNMRSNNPQNAFVKVSSTICVPREPENFIYTFFSRRKPEKYTLGINLKNETVVEEAFVHLPVKIDRLSRPSAPGHADFQRVCRQCLDLDISTVTHEEGKQAGLIRPDGSALSIERMGEGTPGILALIATLSVAKGKLFLIEELENDIHPRALKALLQFILEKSAWNQFLISTHSNIVLSTLGGSPGAHVFSFQMSLPTTTGIPTSTCTLLDGEPASRVRLLEDLGYQPSDLYLYNAYLVLEESTAERIIRDFIVPYMFPALQGKLKTIAAGGISKVQSNFHDFHRLFVYLHTSPQYRNRAWVAVDAGPEGEAVVSEIKDKFQDWPANHFRTWAVTHFEHYYPDRFAGEVERLVAIQNKKDKKQQKGVLVELVLEWCLEHRDEAIEWFNANAQDVLNLLSEIEQALGGAKLKAGSSAATNNH